MNSLSSPAVRRPQRLNAAALIDRLAGLNGEPLAVIVDSAVIDAPIASAIRTALHSQSTWISVDASNAPTLTDAQELAAAIQPVDHVLVVGGGRTIDLVKVATALATIPDLHQRIETSESGIVMDTTPGTRQLIAVPTTLGTGSERSQSAVVDTPRDRTIVVGPCLRPDAYVLDGLASRGLPKQLIVGGVFEALTRTFGPAVGSSGEGALSDIVLATGQRLIALGDNVASMEDPSGPDGDNVRGEIAKLSALSHGSQLHAGRSSSSFKAWFLVTELSWLANCSKVDALARVMGPWMDAISLDDRWGSDVALISLSNHFADPDQTNPHPANAGNSPSGWLSDLMRRWGIAPTTPLAIDPFEATTRVVQRWGTPDLLGLDIDTVLPVMKSALQESAS